MQMTNAIYKFIINAKHGIIAIEAKKQADSIVREQHPEALTYNNHKTLPFPRSIRDLLASWWNSQHSTTAYRKYFILQGSNHVPESTLNNEWRRRLQYIILPRVDAVTEMVMTSLGYTGPGGNIPAWPGVTFPAGTHWYLMLLSTESGTAVTEFLYQHRARLGHKVLESVTMLSLEPLEQQQRPTLIWRVIDYSMQANDQREHRQTAPYQEVNTDPDPVGGDA
ncbi:hypothetical protein LTR86_010516 [Recurvomyces mirabilis]|nr:hypothetical protein LTR86_010516 [Recurvomyces mirabilis]